MLERRVASKDSVTVSILLRASAILTDTAVIAVTWNRMRLQVQEAMKTPVRMTTSAVILADGDLRFRPGFLSLTDA